MVQGVSGNPTASQLFQTNQADARNGQNQNISGPNDVADKTTALAINTEGNLSQGLVNSLNQTMSNLNSQTASLQSGSTSGSQQQQYNNSGQPVTIGTNQTGNLLSKIV